ENRPKSAKPLYVTQQRPGLVQLCSEFSARRRSLRRLLPPSYQYLLARHSEHSCSAEAAGQGGQVTAAETALRMGAASRPEEASRLNISPSACVACCSVMTRGGAMRRTFLASGPSRWIPSPPSPR